MVNFVVRAAENGKDVKQFKMLVFYVVTFILMVSEDFFFSK